MAKKKPKITPTKSLIQMKEGVAPEGMDEEGHMIVVTQMGLAMLVAGLRAIAHESPEVNPLLETLEDALREGFEERVKEASSLPPRDSTFGNLPFERN